MGKYSTGQALAQVFSCEFCKIFKNTSFTGHVWTTASVTISFRAYKTTILGKVLGKNARFWVI